MAEAGVRGVTFTGGGEPTLHPSFNAIVRAAHERGLQIGMYTLGGHIDVEKAETIRHCLSWVVVSLDAPDAETYASEKRVTPQAFDEVCSGVPLVVGVSFLLHAGNWWRTGEMLALGRALGATYVTFRPTILTSQTDLSVPEGDRTWVTDVMPALWALSDEPDVEVDPDRFAEYRDWTGHGYSACLGIRLVTQITPDGRVWVCPNRRGIAGSELGDLAHESFAHIWARHPGQWTAFAGCRVMCRLHLVNRQLDDIYQPRTHEAFI
jgi:MoaA/NifB/PqqE/SkfB family radical SAM enzyme